jgi:capsular exopolysaccharide synthesis family protein
MANSPAPTDTAREATKARTSADLLRPSDECFAAIYQACKVAQREAGERTPSLYGFIAGRKREGASTVAANVAVAAAASGERRVLLVDANFLRPCQSKLFKTPTKPGLAELLDGTGADAADFGFPATRLANFSVLPAGDAAGNPARLYESPRLAALLKLLPLHFSFVVFDLPSLESTKGSLRLAAMLSGVVLVLESERVRREAASSTKDLLTRSGAPLLGGVLNKRKKYLPGWLYNAL